MDFEVLSDVHRTFTEAYFWPLKPRFLNTGPWYHSRFFVALTTQVDGQFDTPFPFSIVRCCSGGHIHFIHPIFRRQPEIAKKYHVKGLTRIFFVFMHQHIMKKVYKETKPSKWVYLLDFAIKFNGFWACRVAREKLGRVLAIEVFSHLWPLMYHIM